MANINEILARAAALRNETALNSIDPERAGGIMYDTLLALNELWLQQGAALVISKIYASVAAMNADTSPVSDLTGNPIRPGMIVVIASSDSDNGSVYRYNGTSAPRWSLVGKIGNITPEDSLTSDSTQLPLAAHQGKVLDGKISQLGQQVIYDVSANNGGATFASLSALLSDANLSTLIPTAVRCGGMSIRFVQTSDNTYVQYFLTKEEWSATESDWEKVNISEKLPIVLYDINGEIATDESITSSNGIYLKTDGTTGKNASLATSDYINISAYRGLSINYNGASSYSSVVAIVVFYDDTFGFISSVSQITSIGSIISIPVPANATYARFCSEKYGINDFSCCVTWEHKIITTLGDLATRAMDEELDVVLYDKNHSIATDANISQENGCYILLSNGNLGYSAALATSDYINISLLSNFNLKLIYNGLSDYSNTVAIVAFYSEDKTFISGLAKVTTLSDDVVSSIPNNAYYVRVCSQKNGIDGFKLSIFGSIKNTIKYSNKKNNNTNQEIENSIRQLTISTGNGSAFNKNSDNTINWGVLNPVLESVGLASILHDIGFIGDSLSAGEIAYKTTDSGGSWRYKDMYEYSWGQRLTDIISGKCTIYAVGGLSTKTWWQRYIENENDGWSALGGNKFSDHKHSSYFIALGTNDSHIPMEIGDATTDIDYEDYNQNADTFIGNYAKIIQKIREGNNRTPIFCVIYPTEVMLRMYDNAIKQMATLFSGVFIIDLYSALLNSGAEFLDYVNGGHWTTPGYQWLSWCIGDYVDLIVRNNLQYFQKQALINDAVDDGTIVW